MINQKKTPAIFNFIKLWVSFLCISFASYGQVDSLKISQDTIRTDTVVNTKDVNKSDIKTTIIFHAKDSVILDMKNKRGFLYEEAQVDYGQTRLEAAEINMDMDNNIVKARPKLDTAGQVVGKPLLTEDGDKILADSIDYNMNSQRGIMSGIVTQQGEGYIGGNRVKKSPENEFYLDDGYYTTCNLEHPHFRIRARKIKLTKNQNVIAGPFNLEIADTPTPLGFAFGIFPKPNRKASGIIVPVYGESRNEGFFLRNGGYYWAINDHVDLKALGEVYTYGNWGINLASNYAKRYYYTGFANLSYNTRFDPEQEGELERTRIRQFWINWSHTPRARGTGRFSASVSAGANSFNRTSSFELQNQLSSTFRSTVSYAKTFKGTPFSMTLSGNHNQETRTNLVNITLPDFNFSMNRIFPFRRRGGNTTGFIPNISVAYNANASVNISNLVQGTRGAGFATTEFAEDSIYAFNTDNLALFIANAEYNLNHSIPISAPYKLLRYLNGTLNFNFNQAFHTERYDYEWVPSGSVNDPNPGAVNIDTVRQLGTSYRYSFGTNLSTNIFGIFQFRGKGRLKAIRHLIQPSVGFSYSPDFTQARYNFYQQDVQVGVRREVVGVDTNGNESAVFRPLTRDLPRYRGVVGGGPSGNITFGVRNTLEAKLNPKSDTASQDKKVMILDEFSANSSYNILADSFNLANIALTARTRIQPFLDINVRGTLDPYTYEQDLETGNFRRVNLFAWQSGRSIGTLTTGTLTLSTSLSPDILKGKQDESDNTDIQQQNLLNTNPNLLDPTANPIDEVRATRTTQENPDLYVDFDIPWTLSVNYSASYNRFPSRRLQHTLSFSGDVSLTPKWRVGFNSSYDFENQQLTATQINLFRDLHCWEMRFFWQPFGQFQSYTFTINVRAGTLRDLKLDRKRTWYDR